MGVKSEPDKTSIVLSGLKRNLVITDSSEGAWGIISHVTPEPCIFTSADNTINGSSSGAMVGEIAMMLPVLVLPRPSETPLKCKDPSAGFASDIIQLFSYWLNQPNCE